MYKNLPKIIVLAICLSASLGYAQPARIVQISPVSVWQAEGNTYDYVGASDTNPSGNNPGTPYGVTYAPGHYGRAFHFDGSSFVQIGPSPSLQPGALTLLAYVKADASPGTYKYLVSQGVYGCAAASYALYTGPTGGLFFYISNGLGKFILSPDVGVGIWDGKYHFVAGTYDGQMVRLYVDGNEVGSGTAASGPITYNLPDDHFYIGSYHGASCELGFTGEIDDVILLNYVLSSAEVHGLLDSDGDGLPDDIEQFGLLNQNGTVLDLPALGANKLRKDIFVRVDYMDCAVPGGDCPPPTRLQPVPHYSHRPKQAAIDLVTQAFRNAPVTNPDGTTGIALHVEVGNAIRHQNSMRPADAQGICGFEYFKDIRQANFDFDRLGHVYHYAVFAHQQKSYAQVNGYQTVSGCGEQPGNDFMVTLGAWNTVCIKSSVPGKKLNPATVLGGDDMFIDFRDADGVQQPHYVVTGQNGICETTAAPGDIPVVPSRDIDGDRINDKDVGTVLQQAGAFMHELGHNLGLGHGGGDEDGYKPNYLSVMNYAFQMTGIKTINLLGGIVTRIDYSGEELPTLVERLRLWFPPSPPRFIGLDETVGIDDGLDSTKWFCPPDVEGIRHIRTALGHYPIDWNCNGILETNVITDVNGDNKFTALRGFDDWQNLKLDFQNTKSFSSGVGQSGVVTEELDFPEALQVPEIARIDIKPGDSGNAINPGASGVIPVAILSDELFDATQVDPLSVRFGPGGATEVHGQGHLEDVNGDGRLDMVLHFATTESGITCGQTSVTLTGTTLGGQVITASDQIKTVACKK